MEKAKENEFIGANMLLEDLLDSEASQSVRTLNVMHNFKIFTLGDFINAKLTIKEMKNMRNFGQKSIDWLMEELKVKTGVEAPKK